MPKQLWIPGGKGGGGHREEFFTALETADLILEAHAKGLSQGAAQERLHRKNDEKAAAKLSDVVGEGYAEALYGTERSGYIISRPSQNPPVLPPLDPVDAPNWTMPLRIGLGLLLGLALIAYATRSLPW